MAIVGFNESSLRNSEIYNQFRDSAAEDPVERVKKLIASAKQLTNEDIESAYIQVKQYSNSLSRAALRAFDTGQTVLLYNTEPKLSMVQLIPFMTFRRGDKYVTYVFMDKFINRGRDGKGSINLNSAVLHDLLVGALIANALKGNYSRLTSSPYLEKTLMSLYTSFLCRILNKEYLLGAEKILYDTIQYYSNRFFLKNIFESVDSDENIETLAKKHFRYIDPMKYDEMRTKYDETNPANVTDLLSLIKELSPRMGSLNLRLFVNNWTNYYFPPAVLAIDNVEYLIFMVVALKNANNLVNHLAADIVKETKNIKTFEEELLKLIS